MAAKSVTLGSRIKLANGQSMPQIHLGVYLTSGDETVNAVRWALEVKTKTVLSSNKRNMLTTLSGWLPSVMVTRLEYEKGIWLTLFSIDSAQMYHNEREVGSSILAYISSAANTSSLKREDIHFTSKLASNKTYDAARKSIKQSVKESGLGYIDLFLLHSPYGGKAKRLECWKAVEDAIHDGEVRSGGVSNFGVKHLQELLGSKPRVHPTVNQIEVHPFNTRTEITSFCQEHDIVVEAYAPLARALRMKHPTITSLSRKYSCTPAQLMIRWSLQHGYVPLPKSVTKSRIIANGDISGFEIEGPDMKTMDSLDEYLVTDWDPVDCD